MASREQVLPLTAAPQSSIGAPLPVVLAKEFETFVVYLTQSPIDPEWDGMTVRMVDTTTRDTVAIARFVGVWAQQFGAPNDEAIEGHPLSAKGLEPYGAFTVINSTWKDELAARNSVHSQHRPEQFDAREHFVLTFHDSIFECVARSVSFDVVDGSIAGVTASVAGRLTQTASD